MVPAVPVPVSVTSLPYASGEVVGGKYRLLEPLGEGGMGQVWLALNLALEVEVALKLLLPELDGRAGAAARLLQEARAAASLRHANIVQIFDFGETEQGDPFIVMERIHGPTLGWLLQNEGRLPATRAVEWLLPVADALALAHAAGIVHRDLKPDNILLDESDGTSNGHVTLKLVDFGIAKLAPRRDVLRLTIDGTVVGSPEYMSPEQARGESDVDHRADIWSFCVVLYECITGVLPFDTVNYHALLRQIIEEPAPSILTHAAGDPALAAIIERGLAKNREARWPSMQAFANALAAWLDTQPAELREPPLARAGAGAERAYQATKRSARTSPPLARAERASSGLRAPTFRSISQREQELPMPGIPSSAPTSSARRQPRHRWRVLAAAAALLLLAGLGLIGARTALHEPKVASGVAQPRTQSPVSQGPVGAPESVVASPVLASPIPHTPALVEKPVAPTRATRAKAARPKVPPTPHDDLGF